MHLFSVGALLLHLEVIYGCGMDLDEKHESSDEYVCVCVCVCDLLSNRERIKMKSSRPKKKKCNIHFLNSFVAKHANTH